MKQLILFLSVVMLLRPMWPIAEYILNYNYIVENLCENKDEPALKCNGKCYLSSKLAKESEKKEKKPFSREYSKLKLPIIDWFQVQIIDLRFFEFVIHTYKNCYELKSDLFTSKILRPPELNQTT